VKAVPNEIKQLQHRDREIYYLFYYFSSSGTDGTGFFE
jgi:hypothetical protein